MEVQQLQAIVDAAEAQSADLRARRAALVEQGETRADTHSAAMSSRADRPLQPVARPVISAHLKAVEALNRQIFELEGPLAGIARAKLNLMNAKGIVSFDVIIKRLDAVLAKHGVM